MHSKSLTIAVEGDDAGGGDSRTSKQPTSTATHQLRMKKLNEENESSLACTIRSG